jgi:hypothetical protein
VHGQKGPGFAVRESEVSRQGEAWRRSGDHPGQHRLNQQYLTYSCACRPGFGRSAEPAAAAHPAHRPGARPGTAWVRPGSAAAAGGPAARDVDLDGQL